MNELLDWFKRRREAVAVRTTRQHLATTISIVDDSEKVEMVRGLKDHVGIIIVRC
ncbi:hypothetical protein GTO27_11055 [Candidatus Bathyarchaeota archaeon]|nr:hypothetical protein [Candidatus Bathyarchaeota archaeon]